MLHRDWRRGGFPLCLCDGGGDDPIEGDPLHDTAALDGGGALSYFEDLVGALDVVL